MRITVDKSYVNRGNLIFTGLLLIIIGFIILYGKTNFLSLVMRAISVAFIINGISQILSIIVKKKDKVNDNATIGHAIINMVLGLVIVVLPNFSLSLLPMSFAIYVLSNGIIKLITICIYYKNNDKIKLNMIIKCTIYFIFGLVYLCNPLMHINDILIIIAVYFFLFGMDFIKDFINEIVPQKTKNNLKRRIRITLPVFWVALIPHKVLKTINEYFEVHNETTDKLKKDLQNDIDLEVFIHVTEDGFGVIGHVDIYYNGEMISYGNYDESSYKLYGMIGNGVLFSCEKDKYIKFCTTHAKKTLFSYGLKLNDHQKSMVEKKINDIKGDVIEWKPPIVFEGYKNTLDEYNDYASVLYKATEARFYKFKSGKFKTYFGLNTNCVLLADSVIGSSGIDILGVGGVITPGTYYEYLKNEFGKRNSIVVSKNIYR